MAILQHNSCLISKDETIMFSIEIQLLEIYYRKGFLIFNPISLDHL